MHGFMESHLEGGEADEQDGTDSNFAHKLHQTRLDALGHGVRQVRPQHRLSPLYDL